MHELGGHPLQLWGWGELKAAHQWRAVRLLYEEQGSARGGVQMLIRRLPGAFKALNYFPRGPFGELATSEPAMTELTAYIRDTYGGTLIAAEPDQEVVAWGRGWRQSSNTILIPRTLILDLAQSEEELLARMTKKTRQYIRKSERDGIVIRQLKTHDDIAQALEIYHETANRAGFPLHVDQYYYDCAEKIGESSLIFGAFHSEKLVSFLWLALSARTAFELYGGMNQTGQDLRANYALKWHAITKCREWEIERYDMNGLLNDGVSAFKQGYSDHETMLAGTYDYPLSPLYAIWSKTLPGAKKVVRRLKTLRK